MRIRSGNRVQGSALLVTLVVGAIIGFTLVAYLSLVHQQNRAINRSQAWNYGIAVAEAGIEEALSHLYYCGQDRTTWAEQGWTLSTNAYVKQRSLPFGYYVVAISNVTPPVIYSHGYAQIPNSTDYLPPRTVRIVTQRNALFRKGMVAKGSIDLSGNNIKTDSFDSSDANFSTNGRYNAAKAKDNGDVATNSSVTNSFKVGNANIFGHASTGPGGAISYGPNGAVGSAAWQQGGNKGVQPGWFTDDMNVSFPDVAAPFSSAAAPGNGNVGGTNYTLVLGNGNYMLGSLSLSGQNKVLVSGRAVLYVTGNVSMAGQSYIYIAPGGSLNLYVGGASASISGNGLANSNASATNFFYWGLPSNTSLSLSGNAAFTGVIYAPQAAFTLGGGGSDDNDFVGASVTGSVRLNGHFQFHYDESLANNGPAKGFIINSWNEI